MAHLGKKLFLTGLAGLTMLAYNDHSRSSSIKNQLKHPEFFQSDIGSCDIVKERCKVINVGTFQGLEIPYNDGFGVLILVNNQRQGTPGEVAQIYGHVENGLEGREVGSRYLRVTNFSGASCYQIEGKLPGSNDNPLCQQMVQESKRPLELAEKLLNY